MVYRFYAAVLRIFTGEISAESQRLLLQPLGVDKKGGNTALAGPGDAADPVAHPCEQFPITGPYLGADAGYCLVLLLHRDWE